MIGRLGWRYIIGRRLMLGVRSFFIVGVLVDHIGIGGKMLGSIRIEMLVLVF